METKDKVLEAAVSLFNAKGYQGSSIREIAKQADVNPALISYYFGGKKGLLENLLLQFYEPYLALLNKIVEEQISVSPLYCLKQIGQHILNFQQQHIQLTSFVYREMTLDSMLVREMMSTYLKKETYYIQQVFTKGIELGECMNIPTEHAVIQFKGMLMMPFLYPRYLSEVLYLQPVEGYFVERYSRQIEQWIDSLQLLEPLQLQAK
ncbi:forespore capture DNA-binding protein RefZ [Bacillus solimangrovi]|nr:forespore capture DNA-binding protein RefZ [Bacillus solimangrovi]